MKLRTILSNIGDVLIAGFLCLFFIGIAVLTIYGIFWAMVQPILLIIKAIKA